MTSVWPYFGVCGLVSNPQNIASKECFAICLVIALATILHVLVVESHVYHNWGSRFRILTFFVQNPQDCYQCSDTKIFRISKAP